VVIGGLALSALLTLLLIPPMLSVLLAGRATEPETDAVAQAAPAE
jgi:Cu/Ag efflux pump CusA